MIKLLLSSILLIVVILIYWYSNSGSTYVKSNVDGKLYLVKDVADKQNAADTLATIKLNINKLVNYMLVQNNPEYVQYIVTLKKKINDVVIAENIKDIYYTSYSVNKGEKLVFCLRSRQNQFRKHDINLLMYVVLHEISHVACPEYGHGELFKKIFKYITQCAINLNIYVPIDFKNIPTEYCGMMITESIV